VPSSVLCSTTDPCGGHVGLVDDGPEHALVLNTQEGANLRDKVLVAMGGTCVTRQCASDAWADIWAEDVASADFKMNAAPEWR
jgi:hypothetical protein